MAPPPSWVDSLIVAYLLAHGVIALLVDVQSIVPDIAPSLLPLYEAAGLRAIVRSWANVHGDFLVATNPLWFKSFIGCEVPACFALARAWSRRLESARMPAVVYSVHVLTSMAPISLELCAARYAPQQRPHPPPSGARGGEPALPPPTLVCLVVYGVWIALPALLLSRALAPPPIFGAAGSSAKGKRA